MSEKDFIKLLQNIITMVDPEDSNSISLGKLALESLINLAMNSGKVDGMTARMMHRASAEFEFMVERKVEFEGRPGAFSENEHKRRRLMMMLRPGC